MYLWQAFHLAAPPPSWLNEAELDIELAHPEDVRVPRPLNQPLTMHCSAVQQLDPSERTSCRHPYTRQHNPDALSKSWIWAM